MTAITIILTPEQLDDLATRVAARLSSGRTATDRLPLREAAAVAGLRGRDPARVLRDAARRGELTIERVGRAPVVARAELDRWLATRKVAPAAPASADGPTPDELDAALARRSA
jgi:hypothetical protein